MTPSQAPIPEAGRLRGIAWLERGRPWLLIVASLIIGGLLFEALRGVVADLSYAAVSQALRDVPAASIVGAMLATGVSYLALTGYDYCALRHAGVSLPYGIVGRTAFVAYALANSIGLGVLTGGAVRMRMYAAAGVETGRISGVIMFTALCFGIGTIVTGALALLWGSSVVAGTVGVPENLLRAGAGAVLAAGAVVLVRLGRGGTRQWFRLVTVKLPDRRLALGVLALALVDITASAAVLWVLLPAGAIGFAAFTCFYATAILLGVASHVPGGLGVFEGVMLLALSGQVSSEHLAAALVLNRLVYYVLPLLLALTVLLVEELRPASRTPLGRAAASLSPVLLAAVTLVAGVLLLVSGVSPPTAAATARLAAYVPLPLVEASHFLGSIAGLGLLFVARGMLLRSGAAWWAGLLTAAGSIALVLMSGRIVWQILPLALVAAALLVSRRQFRRDASLVTLPFTGGWLLATLAIVAALAGLLLFAYRDVAYGSELWWQFELDAHASRSMRALVAVSVGALALALWQLLRPAVRSWPRADRTDLARAADIVRTQASADAWLALTGDKHLLFSDSGRSFVMFGRRGHSWVALFDPVGPAAERREMIWRFIEAARSAGGRPSFYQIRPGSLPAYLDAGLRLFKLGEYASVSLPGFSLVGKPRARLRQSLNHGTREGLRLEVIEPERVADVLTELEVISDAWLRQHRTSEKSFSLGAFSPSYLRLQPIALVSRGDEPVAFANLLLAGEHTEASVDLMRYRPDAPPGTMDYLFVALMLRLKEEGFQSFGLGMSPLSGMAEHPLAPAWHHLGRLLFSHGEHFYNFQGIRAFKNKFDPEWEARYLACPGGAAPLFVLADIAALVGGGLKGTITR